MTPSEQDDAAAAAEWLETAYDHIETAARRRAHAGDPWQAGTDRDAAWRNALATGEAQ